VIVGIKEVPKSELIPDKAFCFFSHVIKGQPHNMPVRQVVYLFGFFLIFLFRGLTLPLPFFSTGIILFGF